MLRYKADRRTWMFILAYFALTASVWVFPVKPLWGKVLIVSVLASLSFFGAVITHNTIHAPMFHARFLNRVTQVILTLTYGHPVSSFVPGHNLSHHRYTQSRRDVMRTTKVQFKWNLLNGLFFMFRMAPDIMRADSKYTASMRKRRPAWFRQMLIELFSLYAVYGILIYLDWKLFLWSVFIPHRYAGFGIITMNFLQHDGCDENSKYNHSRNFVGKIVNWFTFNNGYHTIHHEKPNLHWSLLPETHKEQIAPHIHPALDQASIAKYLFKAFIYPAKRLRYDGKPVILPKEGPDEDWIPHPNELPPEVSLGAV